MDRLTELKRNAPKPDTVAIEMSNNLSASPMHDKQSSLDVFLNDVEIIQKSIHVIDEATHKLKEIDQRMMLATTSDKELVESQQLNDIIKFTNKKASGTKKLLQALRDYNDNERRTGANHISAAELKVRDNHITTLTRKFVEVMKDYQLIQSKYKTDIKNKVRRQVTIAKPDASEEEVDAIMKSPDGTSQLLQSTILKGEANTIIQDAVQRVNDKYHDILALESSIMELHQMFLDFALLTEQQSELLDQIEYQVKEASDYIDKGNEQLTEAIELTKSIRRKQCCCCLMVFIIIGALVGIIMGTVAVKNGGL